MLVPSSYGGAVEPCPNHPKDPAVGFCYNCGRSGCKSCLQVDRSVKSVLCQVCLREREIRRGHEETQKRVLLASVVLIVIVFGSLVAYSIYTYSTPIGSAWRNWAALGSVSEGLHVMITSIDPRQMNETNLNRYFTDRGTRNDFVSIVLCGTGLAEIEYKKTTLQPYMRHLEVAVTYYTCGRFYGGANVIPTPHTETVIIFLGRLDPGSYTVTAKIYDGGAIAYRYEEGHYYKVFSSDSGGGGTSIVQTSFTIS